MNRNYIAGLKNLANSELQLGSLIARGLSNEEITEHLPASISTIKRDISRLMDKLDINPRRRSMLATLFKEYDASMQSEDVDRQSRQILTEALPELITMLHYELQGTNQRLDKVIELWEEFIERTSDQVAPADESTDTEGTETNSSTAAISTETESL